MKTVDAQTMQALDRKTIDELGLPGLVLMERAALGLEAAVLTYFSAACKQVLIMVGSGNNGADGLVLARLLHSRGIPVQVVWHGTVGKTSAEHQLHWRINAQLGIEQLQMTQAEDFMPCLASATLVVDAIFGVGLSRPISGFWAEVIETLNQRNIPVVAVDMPSGIHGDTGQVMGCAVVAEMTVTFAFPKWGLLMDSALDHVGRLEIVDIGIPAAFAAEEPGHLLTPAQIATWMPGPRERATHKGKYGKLAIIAGSLGMSGAAVFAAKAALYTGVGIVYLLVPESIQAQVAAQLPEALVMPYSEVDILVGLQPYFDVAHAVLLGPGLGQSEAWKNQFQAVLAACHQPLVLDADGLNLWGRAAGPFQHPTVITPHVGELGRILEQSASHIQQDRIASARAAAQRFQCIHLLKGANSLIAEPDGNFWVNPTGNPLLARGGSGDVLAGLIGGLMAQGFLPEQAACIGGYWHGLAADMLANQKNEVTITVGEFIAYLPPAYQQILSDSCALKKNQVQSCLKSAGFVGSMS